MAANHHLQLQHQGLPRVVVVLLVLFALALALEASLVLTPPGRPDTDRPGAAPSAPAGLGHRTEASAHQR